MITKRSLRLYEPKKRGIYKVDRYGGLCKRRECCEGKTSHSARYASKSGKCRGCGKQMKEWIGFNDKMEMLWARVSGRDSDKKWFIFMKKNGARIYAKV